MSSSAADTARFWEHLLQFIEEGRVIPVVGQDLLTVRLDEREGLLYAHLADRLARYFQIPAAELPSAPSLHAVACRYLARGGELEDFYPAVKAVMPARETLTVPEPLRKLAAIRPFKLFVSATFDSLLCWAIDEVRFGGQARTQVFAYSPNAAEDLPCEVDRLQRPAVFHLFGRLSVVPDYAVTEEDTLEFVHSLQSETKRPQLLFDEFYRRHLLIVGGGFADWLARFFVRIGKRERLWLARGKTDVLADARVRHDVELVTFLRHFSTRTKVYQDGGPVDFVNELYRRWTESHPDRAAPSTPAPAVPGRAEMPPGAVFLSYASEDVAAVEAIKILDARQKRQGSARQK